MFPMFSRLGRPGGKVFKLLPKESVKPSKEQGWRPPQGDVGLLPRGLRIGSPWIKKGSWTVRERKYKVNENLDPSDYGEYGCRLN